MRGYEDGAFRRDLGKAHSVRFSRNEDLDGKGIIPRKFRIFIDGWSFIWDWGSPAFGWFWGGRAQKIEGRDTFGGKRPILEATFEEH